MPYSSISEVPKWVRDRGEKKARQWMHIFNSVYKQTGDEGRAFRAANAAIGKKKEKKNA